MELAGLNAEEGLISEMAKASSSKEHVTLAEFMDYWEGAVSQSGWETVRDNLASMLRQTIQCKEGPLSGLTHATVNGFQRYCLHVCVLTLLYGTAPCLLCPCPY